MLIDAKLLAADRALDQAWRGGIGVAMAVTRAQELSDPLRLDVLLEDAKVIVSDPHACSPDEASARLCFVSCTPNADSEISRLRSSQAPPTSRSASPTSPHPVSTGSRSSP